MTNGQTKIWNKKPQELKTNPSHAGKPVGMARGGQDEKTWIYYIRKFPPPLSAVTRSTRKEGPPQGACRSRSFATIRVRRVTTPDQARVALGPRAQTHSSSLPAPLQKHWNIAPLFCQGVCGCFTGTATTSSIWGKAVRLASCMMNFPELSGSGLEQGASTHNSSDCKNFRDEHNIVFAKAVQDQTNCH